MSFLLLLIIPLFHFLNDGPECFRMMHRKVGKGLPVQFDSFLLEVAYELRITHSVLTYTCINPLYPQRPEFTFFLFPVAVCISHTFVEGVLGYRDDIFP